MSSLNSIGMLRDTASDSTVAAYYSSSAGGLTASECVSCWAMDQYHAGMCQPELGRVLAAGNVMGIPISRE